MQGVDGVQALVRGPPILYHRDLKGSACCDYLTCKLMRVSYIKEMNGILLSSLA